MRLNERAEGDTRPTRPELDALAARYGPAAAVAITSLAFALRLPGIFGWWVNPDEGIYYAVLTQERLSLFWSESFATAHPPLYYLLLRGMGLFGTDLAWLRSLALVSGCGAVWMFVQIGKDIAGSSARGWLTGLLAGLVLALSPVAITLSQVIRPYMLLVLLLALALHTLLRYFERPSGRGLLLYASCASLAALLHYSSILAFGVIAMLIAADGAARGIARPEWRRLVAVQALPAIIVGILYVTHVRWMMRSDHIDFAVEIWLTDYLIHAPVDAWLTLVGFHAALVGSAASVPATFLTLGAIAGAARSGRIELFLAVGGALIIATVCAALGLYPYGAGRHSAWLIPFVTPGIAWVVASAVAHPGRARARGAVGGAVVAGFLLRAPLGAEEAAPALPEQVLRTNDVAAMAEVLDPQGEPRVVVMSLETYRLLMPLYYRERQAARVSTDLAYLHFRWGVRDVFVLPGLDVSVRPEELEQPNHLYAGTRRAAAEFGVALEEDESILVLSGDWRRSVFELSELARQRGLVGTGHAVPGLVGITVDLDAYGRALEGFGAAR